MTDQPKIDPEIERVIRHAESKPGFCRCGEKLQPCPWGVMPHGFCPMCEPYHIEEHRNEYQGGGD